jgi:mannose-6-phosphate isomerase-like protein (cupin superfamily)
MTSRLEAGEPVRPAPGVELRELQLAVNGVPLAPFQASRFSVRPGVATEVDQHAVRECWLVVQGAGTVRHDGRDLPAAAGDAFLFDSQERHQLRNDGPEEMVVVSLWWPA